MNTVPTNASATKRNNSSSLRRALSLLAFIAERASGGHLTSLPDLTAGTGLPKSTLKRFLEPLIDHGLVRVDATTGRYGLGSYTASLGGIYLNGLDIRAIARPTLQEITLEVHETAHLLALAGTDIVCIDKVDAPNPVRMHSWIGNRLPLYCTASGKAVLAYQPEEAVQRVIHAGLEPLTPNTITSAERLHLELKNVRDSGVAIDDIESQDGIRCVGAPIFDQHTHPTAAISVSGPTTRMTTERTPQLAELVRDAAAEISTQLGAGAAASAHRADADRGDATR